MRDVDRLAFFIVLGFASVSGTLTALFAYSSEFGALMSGVVVPAFAAVGLYLESSRSIRTDSQATVEDPQ